MANSTRRIRLNRQQRIDWLRLARSPGIGSATFRDLLLFCGSVERAIAMAPELHLRSGRRQMLQINSIASAERELALLERLGASLVTLADPDYPQQLRHGDPAPPVLAIKGDVGIFQRPAVAIVGSRNASLAGCGFTQKLAADLGTMGYVIVSGMARGIDARAHQASLATGTIAVLAGGLDQPYPPQNLALYHAIPQHMGALVSEMPMGSEPRARDFPRRNRIIAGLALGLVVVEAAEQSGSLISARLAAELGRLVFAVPGFPLDPRARGTNQLIKQGANLVTDAEDVAAILRPLHPAMTQAQQQELHFSDPLETPPARSPDEHEALLHQLGQRERQLVLNCLSTSPIDLDSIIRHTGLDPTAIQLIILELDLAGAISRYPGNLIARNVENG